MVGYFSLKDAQTDSSDLEPLSTKLQPCSASLLAIPSPIPDVDPVTIATLPFNGRDPSYQGKRKYIIYDVQPRSSACGSIVKVRLEETIVR